MEEPVSWLLIRPGWRVYAVDGTDVGAVDAVTGDDGKDIFDGLAVATSPLAKPKYVPAEQVGPISDGAVHLTLTTEQVDELEEYLEPATSAVIEPDSRGGMGEAVSAEARKLEGEAFAPIQRHEHSMSIWQRLALFVRRLFG